MIDWYKKEALFLILISFFLGKQSVGIAAFKSPNKINLNYHFEVYQSDRIDSLQLSTADFNRPWSVRNLILPTKNWKVNIDNRLAKETNSCQNINSAYQQVYGFATKNYYINICQLGNKFYYYRQSKFDDEALLIRAKAISYGDIFQATSDGTTYFVGKDSDRYYSSVMYNDNEIVFEPELPRSPEPALEQNIAEANSDLPNDGVKANQTTSASLELDGPQGNYSSQQPLICTGENTANSHLNYWQKLLGKSPTTANQYAISNGHNFVYDAHTPERATIATKEGAIVDLNIAMVSQTIERVCIRSVAEN
jgi:hypothetical protein